MSQAREMFLRMLARYAKNHTSIDVYDVVAFYSSMHTPPGFPYTVNLETSTSSLGKEGFSVWEKVVKKTIKEIKETPAEMYEGTYEYAMQVRWDNGNGSPHYYCSKICREID